MTIRRLWCRPFHSVAAAALLLSLLSTGCVRRTIRTTHAIFVRSAASLRKKSMTLRAPTPKHDISPDDIIRRTFQQQASGAFNPITDNRKVPLLETRLHLNPADVTARLELAGIYERYGLSEQALDEYKRAVSYASESSTGASVSQAESAVEGLARCARATGRGPEAIPVLAEFVKRWPAAGIWNELGMLYDEAGDWRAAEQSFRQAIARDAKSEAAHNNLGYNLLLQSQPEAAETEFRRALQLNPKSQTARNNLAAVLARRGDLDAAFEQFRLAASDVATAHNNLAVVLLELGYYERGRDELVKALTARYYFAPPMQNYKLVQELLRQRAQLVGAGDGLPLSTVRVAPSILLAAGLSPGDSPSSAILNPDEQNRRPDSEPLSFGRGSD